MSAPPEIGAAIPQYDVGGELGRGGMGVVYAATHRALARQVAVKQLPAELARGPRAIEHFQREARLLATLDHPHIVPVYDFVHDTSVPGRETSLLVMERLDGGSVWSRFAERGLAPEESCALVLATLAGLHGAHRAGVLHLDVKPKNLLLTGTGMLKIADFGIARVLTDGAALATTTGEVLGTPAYLAPEQALGTPLTAATDVYATATVLYELLSGRRPYSSEGGALLVVHRHIAEDARPLPDTVPRPVAEVVLRGLARDPLVRYPDAESFAEALGAAAAMAYGAGWLERSGIPVQLTPRVVHAAARVPAVTSPSPTQLAPVHPTGFGALPTVGVAEVGSAPLVPVAQVLARRQSPWPPVLIAVAGVLLLALVALLGQSTPTRPAPLRLTVGGAPAGVAFLDLTAPIALTGTSAGPIDGVRLSLSAAGVSLGEASGAVRAAAGPWRVTLDPPDATRWTAGGAVTGRVDTLRAGRIVGSQEFTARPAQAPYLSVMGTGSVLLLLFAVAYLESLLRALRRGRRRMSGLVGAAPLGAVVGLAGWMLASVFTRHEPGLPLAVACAVLGAIAAVAAAVATARAAVFRRPASPAPRR